MFTFSEMLALVQSESSFGAFVCLRRPAGLQATSDLVDRWPLKQGFPETDSFLEGLLNSCERCGTHAFDLRNDNSRQSGAHGGLMR